MRWADGVKDRQYSADFVARDFGGRSATPAIPNIVFVSAATKGL